MKLLVAPAALAALAVATPPTTPAPPTNTVAAATEVVPSLAADPAVFDAPAQATFIAAQMAAPTNQVATTDEVGTICAVLLLAAPLAVGGRWERDGDVIREVPAVERQPPGFGDCLAADDGRLAEGTYQFLATGPGVASAAPTFVVGADPVAARFLNDGTEPVCLLQVSPRGADRYESYSLDPALAPGEVAGIMLAAVDHDVGVFECTAAGSLEAARPDRTFSFTPDGTDIPLSG